MSPDSNDSGIRLAGVDEAGRGPLAGPVIAAAVILDPGQPIEGLRDSKRLTGARRLELYDEICNKSLAWSVGRADVHEIDELNILQATLAAMARAVNSLDPAADRALVDGRQCPALLCPAEAIIKGDDKVPAISAASIIAKVTRDKLMIDFDAVYPGYGLAQHKGYPSKAHIEALQRLGVTPIHRRSYAPVRKVLEGKRDQALAGDDSVSLV